MRNPRPGSLIAGGLIAVLAASSSRPRAGTLPPGPDQRQPQPQRRPEHDLPLGDGLAVRRARMPGPLVGAEGPALRRQAGRGRPDLGRQRQAPDHPDPDAGHGHPDGDPGRQADPRLGLAGQGRGAPELHRPQGPRRPGMAGRVQRVALPLRHGMERRTRDRPVRRRRGQGDDDGPHPPRPDRQPAPAGGPPRSPSASLPTGSPSGARSTSGRCSAPSSS